MALNVERFLAFLREGHPQTIRIVEAYVAGESALVLFAGEGPYSRIEGEALLVREEGEWRFEEETIRPLLGGE